MALKFKGTQGNGFTEEHNARINKVLSKYQGTVPNTFTEPDYIYDSITCPVPHLPKGAPDILTKTRFPISVKNPASPKNAVNSMPESNLKRAVYYGADLGGCYAWRLGFPSFWMKFMGKAVISELSTMVVDPRFYIPITSVTLQRQANQVQKSFVEFVKKGAKELGFKIIYEIDDIVFREDIPDYNACKGAFDNPEIRRTIEEIIDLCDEMTVTCDYMRDYYKSKTKISHVTVVPNYIPRFWFDGHYHEDELSKNYELHKKRPKVLYIGSGTHFDNRNSVNQKDDFYHVTDFIKKTVDKYEWIFMGGCPPPLIPYHVDGKIKVYPWTQLLHLGNAIHAVGANLTYAPLIDNNFNKSKSNIKLLESGSIGLPCIAQDMCTYKEAELKFKTGEELLDQIDHVMKDHDSYMQYCRNARAYTNTMWLDNEENWQKRYEVTFYKVGDPNRKYIKQTNPDEK